MGNGNRLVDGNGTDSDSLDGHDRLPVAVERFVADEHSDVRSHGVSHHVGDLQAHPSASSTPNTLPSLSTPA